MVKFEKNSLSDITEGINEEIIKNHSKFIFSDDLKLIYPDYRVYISVDRIDRNKCEKYFGYHLKGLITTDNIEIKPQIKSFTNVSQSLTSMIISFHRMELAFKMVAESKIEYKYIIKIRPDVLLYQSIASRIQLLDIIPNRQIYFVWDIILIGRYNIMKYYCNIVNLDIQKTVQKCNYQFINNGMFSYDKYHCPEWGMDTAEIQLCEILMKYIVKNNMNIDESFKDSRINFTLGNRQWTHFGNNNFLDNYYYYQDEDYRLLL